MLLLLFISFVMAADMNSDTPDPHQWLEDVAGEEALDWVRGHNATSVAALAGSEGFKQTQAKLLSILESDDRIPMVSHRDGYLYNVWRDAKNPRGLWRRTTMESYRTDDPKWDVILDLDALGKAEDENWVWHGANCLTDSTLCLVSLSRGGADADVVREFDTETRAFVEGGFALPEAKSNLSWIDRDTVLVGTDFGEGSLTDSGYARIVKRWTRGTPLESAEVIYEGTTEDVWVYGWHDSTKGYERTFVSRGLTFYTNEVYELHKGALRKIAKPDGAMARVHRDGLYFELRDWDIEGTTYAKVPYWPQTTTNG